MSFEQFDISREQINEVLEFAARSLDAPAPAGSALAVTAATPGSYTEVKFETGLEGS